MKLYLCILLSSIVLVSCSGKDVKESSDDIASISDEELISNDPLLGDNSEMSNNDDEVTSLEDDLLLEEKTPAEKTQEVVETKPEVEKVKEITNADVNESISMDDELVPTGLSDEPTNSNANQGVSGLMVLDTETQEWIPANKCVHIIKNDVYTEPTCLKRR